MGEPGQPKFRIEKQTISQMLRCESLLVSEIVNEIKDKTGSVADIDPENDIFRFCKPLDPDKDIKDLVDEKGNLSHIEVEWDGMLNHLYSKFGKDIRLIPNILINKIDETEAVES